MQRGRSDEAARLAEAEAATLRQRLAQVEGSLRAKEREVEKMSRALQVWRAHSMAGCAAWQFCGVNHV